MKNRRLKSCLFAVGFFAVGFFLLPLFLRVGYCQSWWGKENLYFRSWWLCACSEEFEQSLYPDNVEVLVSACECEDGQRATRAGLTVNSPLQMVVEACSASPAIQEVPGGRLLFVEHYFIDLYTGQRIPFTPPGKIAAWITEDLFWYQKAGGLFLFSMEKQANLPVVDLFKVKPDLLNEDESIDLPQLANELKQMKAMIVTEIIGVAQALAVNTQEGVEVYFYLNDKHFMDNNQGDLVTFLDTLDIPYGRFEPFDKLSPTGQWVAKDDEIYDAETGQQVYDFGVNLPTNLFMRGETSGTANFSLCCWRADERVLILTTRKQTPTLFPSLALPVPPVGSIGMLFGVSQPTLLATLPEEVFDSVP